jgi:hypothetical protein
MPGSGRPHQPHRLRRRQRATVAATRGVRQRTFARGIIGRECCKVHGQGAGSSELIVGTGKDDVSDALDRRVEFKTIPCAVPIAKTDETVQVARASSGNTARSKRTAEDGEYSALRIPRGIELEIRRYLNSGGLRQLLEE